MKDFALPKIGKLCCKHVLGKKGNGKGPEYTYRIRPTHIFSAKNFSISAYH